MFQWLAMLMGAIGSAGVLICALVMGGPQNPLRTFWFLVAVAAAAGLSYFVVHVLEPQRQQKPVPVSIPRPSPVSYQPVSKPRSQPRPVPKPKPVHRPAPKPNIVFRPPTSPLAKDRTVYHGTPSLIEMNSAIRDGFIPGPGSAYGTGVYLASDFDTAKSYARDNGYIFKLYIRTDTPVINYDLVPGKDSAEKRAYCLRNGNGLVFHPQTKYFICYGQAGAPLKIPGLEHVEVFDVHGNQITFN